MKPRKLQKPLKGARNESLEEIEERLADEDFERHARDDASAPERVASGDGAPEAASPSPDTDLAAALRDGAREEQPVAGSAPEAEDRQQAPLGREKRQSRPGRLVLALSVAASAAFLLAALVVATATEAPVLVVAMMAAASALLAVGGVTLSRLARFGDHRRGLISDVDRLRARIESLTDQTWELRDSLELYRSVVDTVGDIVIRKEATGKVRFVNEAFTRTFGIAARDVIGKPLALRPLGEKAMDHAGRPERHVLLRTGQGQRWFRWRDTTIAEADGTPLTQSVLRDVTEDLSAENALVEAREKAEAASLAKSRFVATVSHEIRTPLNGILGMTSLMADTPLSSEQISYVEAVKSSGEALLTLVEDVLDFSKIEAGRLELAPARTELRTLVETLVELIAPRAHAKSIEIAGYIAPGVPEAVLVDGPRLRQVLINLAGNGVKFTETGGVSLEVTPANGPAPDAGARLTFTIRDTGIGLNRAETRRIFEEFEQAEPGPARRYGGTGLGLAISRRLVRLMGGDIGVDSAPGAGAAFAFTLDLPVLAPAPEAETLDDRRILIVSRSLVEMPLLARSLSQLGADVEMVGDAEAVSPGAASSHPFDVVLVDAHCAEGPVAVREALIARGVDVPSVVLVTPGERGELASYREEGFDAYLVKPVRGASLLRVISAVTGAGVGAADFEVGRLTVPRYVPARPLSVLLAEDNDINALLARSALEKLGHQVRVVGDGRAAVNAYLAGLDGPDKPYDCVLMDLHMPGLDGFQAIALIRDLEEERGTARIPILALTADAMAESEVACRAAGADLRLTKPLDVDELGAVLDKAVDAA